MLLVAFCKTNFNKRAIHDLIARQVRVSNSVISEQRDKRNEIGSGVYHANDYECEPL